MTLRIYSPSVSVRAGVLSLAMTARGDGGFDLATRCEGAFGLEGFIFWPSGFEVSRSRAGGHE